MSEEHRASTTPRSGDGFNPGAALVGLLVIALGVIFLLEALDVATIPREIIFPALLIAIGVAIVISALWRGRR